MYIFWPRIYIWRNFFFLSQYLWKDGLLMPITEIIYSVIVGSFCTSCTSAWTVILVIQFAKFCELSSTFLWVFPTSAMSKGSTFMIQFWDFLPLHFLLFRQTESCVIVDIYDSCPLSGEFLYQEICYLESVVLLGLCNCHGLVYVIW